MYSIYHNGKIASHISFRIISETTYKVGEKIWYRTEVEIANGRKYKGDSSTGYDQSLSCALLDANSANTHLITEETKTIFKSAICNQS